MNTHSDMFLPDLYYSVLKVDLVCLSWVYIICALNGFTARESVSKLLSAARDGNVRAFKGVCL